MTTKKFGLNAERRRNDNVSLNLGQLLNMIIVSKTFSMTSKGGEECIDVDDIINYNDISFYQH